MYHMYKGQVMLYTTVTIVYTVLTSVCSGPWFKCISYLGHN